MRDLLWKHQLAHPMELAQWGGTPEIPWDRVRDLWDRPCGIYKNCVDMQCLYTWNSRDPSILHTFNLSVGLIQFKYFEYHRHKICLKLMILKTNYMRNIFHVLTTKDDNGTQIWVILGTCAKVILHFPSKWLSEVYLLRPEAIWHFLEIGSL